MALFLFANDAATTLAGPIAANSTTANLAAGSGALFPSPGAGQQFAVTFTKAGDTTGLTLNEIAYVTARSGDTITLLRGQEGTSAKAWSAGDQVQNLWTAGSAQVMVQEAELQLQPGNYAVAGGTPNAQVITLTPAPSNLVGAPIRFKSVGTNTGATTLQITGSVTASVLNQDASSLGAGQLQTGGIYEVVYNGTAFCLIGNPFALLSHSGNTWIQSQNFSGGFTGTTGTLSGGFAANSLTAGSGGVTSTGNIYSSTGLVTGHAGIAAETGNISASAGQVIGHTGVYAETGNVQASTGFVRALSGAYNSGDLYACCNLNDFTGGTLAHDSWTRLPNGFIMQWGFAQGPTSPGAYASWLYPVPFNNFFSLVLTPANQTGNQSVSWIVATASNGFTFSCSQANISTYYMAFGI